jgi:WD40 repeat protein
VVASAGADGAVRFWDVDTGQPLGALEGGATALGPLTWRPEDRAVAAAGRDGSIRVAGLDGNGPRAVLLPLVPGQGFALSPEGHWLAPPERESALVVVVQTDAGQEVYPPGVFRARFRWPNDPGRVRLGPR